MDTCTPLAPGTILRTMSGTEFRLLAEHTVGGNAILYRAKQIDSQLDVTLKELCPPGSHRAGGILVSRSAGDVLLQRKADKLLKERAAEEFGSGQSINNETLHALLTLGLLDIRSIQEPDGTVYQNADGTSLPCVFLYMPTLNKAKGFFSGSCWKSAPCSPTVRRTLWEIGRTSWSRRPPHRTCSPACGLSGFFWKLCRAFTKHGFMEISLWTISLWTEIFI